MVIWVFIVIFGVIVLYEVDGCLLVDGGILDLLLMVLIVGVNVDLIIVVSFNGSEVGFVCDVEFNVIVEWLNCMVCSIFVLFDVSVVWLLFDWFMVWVVLSCFGVVVVELDFWL